MTLNKPTRAQLSSINLGIAITLWLVAGLFRSIPTLGEIATLTLASFFSLLAVWSKVELRGKNLLLISISIALFVYTFAFSPFLGRSLVQAFYFFVAALIFICFTTAQKQDSAQISVTYKVFLFFGTLHALALIALYLEKPIRVTGLMEDYSQASLLILFAFALNYARLKTSSYFSAICLVLFLGFFTTFSRTANALLALFLFSLFWFEWRHGRIGHIVKTVTIVLLSLVSVYLYPKLINLATINRGGLSQFNTLNSRTIYWESAWNAIKEKPIVGHGLGNFEWTGIKEARPFKVIHHVHNDYLQIWHDLGIFWLAVLLLTLAWLLLRNIPVQTIFGKKLSTSHISEEGYISWVLLCCLALYMSINFALYSIPLQAGILLCLLRIQYAR